MDPKEEILERLREGLKGFAFEPSNDHSQDSMADDKSWNIDGLQLADIQTLDFSNIQPLTTATISGLSGANVYLGNGPGGGGYTWTNTGTPGLDARAHGKISLKGDSADIDIDGVSLRETLRGIQDRLNMLAPNVEMEQQWEELREIRESYEAKLKECQSKSRTWQALKS